MASRHRFLAQAMIACLAIPGAVLATLLATCGMAQETARKMPPETITVKEFAANERPEEGDLWLREVRHELVSYFAQAKNVRWNSQRRVNEALLKGGFTHVKPNRKPLESGTVINTSVSYPLVAEGDLLPLGGYVCRMTKTFHDQRQKVVFTVLQEDELPKGVSHPGLMGAAPIGGRMYLASNGEYLLNEVVKPDPAKDDLAVRASLRQFASPMKEVFLKVGDEVSGKYDNGFPWKFLIRGIVPPNPEKKMIGWLLYEPDWTVFGDLPPKEK